MENVSELKVGAKVFHDLFGAGSVRDISGSGPATKISIDFGASIGVKKLLAASAPLRLANAGGDVPQSWCERLLATAVLRRGQRMPSIQFLRETLLTFAKTDAFWIAVRDELRAKQLPAPKVLDQPSGCVAVSVRGQIELEIQVKHAELLRPEQRVLARTLLDVLARECLREFDIAGVRTDFGPGNPTAQADVITTEDAEPLQVPDRAPKHRPLPVRPKGVITNRPRRRDDY